MVKRRTLTNEEVKKKENNTGRFIADTPDTTLTVDNNNSYVCGSSYMLSRYFTVNEDNV